MRTKTLLIAAAALAVGLASTQAQTVYSANIVGYANIPLNAGFTLFANQFDLDGTGTNNTVQSIFGTNLPSGSVVYAFQNGAFATPAAGYTTKGGWSGGTNAANAGLSIGSAVFVKVPSSNTVTLVGTVFTGTNVVNFANGYNFVTSPSPRSGLLQTDLGYVPTSGDVVYRFDPVTQQYKSPASGYTTKGGWSGGGEPVINVGEGIFLKSAAASGGSWTNILNP
jgi:hypothetical protein